MRPPISIPLMASPSVQADVKEKEHAIPANPNVVVLITIAANVLLFVCLYL